MDNDNEIPIPVQYEFVPPDGGWGWLVLFGATLVNMLVPGIIKSFGVLFVEFIESFQLSEVAASWIPAFCYFLYCSLGPLASYLSAKYSYRTVTLIGGTLASMGMILSCFATSYIHLCITYGLLFGAGAGLSFPPGIFIVTSYFQKYRGFANGVAISGSAFGSMVLPPLLRYLLHTYGLSGAILILGAITMNVWVGALLYQPLEWHMKRVAVTRDDDTKCEDETTAITTTKDDTLTASPIIITTTAPNGLVTSYEKLDETVLVYSSSTKTVTVGLAGGRRNCALTFTDNKHSSSRPSVSSRLGHATSSITSCDSTLGRLHPEYTSQVTLKSITESLGHLSYFDCCHHTAADDGDESHAVVTLIELFKNPIFIIILISNASTAVGYTNFYIFLPSYAISLRYTKTLSSCLLSVTACFDLIGRIGGATVSDVLPLRKRVYFVAGLAISGLVLIVLPLTRTYVGLCVACAAFGLASGTYVGVTVVTMVEMLGEQKLADAYTVSLFVNGLLQMVGPPICGLVYDNWKSFGVIISSLGATVACGASAWILLPLVEAKNSSRT